MLNPTVTKTRDPVSSVPDDRAVTAAAVLNLGVAIATGACTPQPIELEALALICDHHQLPMEAARVRTWLAAMERR